MAKTNNKGFSLIEIVIAVAILSILLTPIMHQFANTLNTSRRAKALQAANEKASYQMEEFQTVSRDKLDDPGYYGTPVTKTDNTAELYKTDGTSLSKSVTYTTYTYTLPDCEIGAKKISIQMLLCLMIWQTRCGHKVTQAIQHIIRLLMA